MSNDRSNHSADLLSLKLNDFTHGKGLWKFNNALLYDKECLPVDVFNKKKLQEIKQNYAVPVYNNACIDKIPNDEIRKY